MTTPTPTTIKLPETQTLVLTAATSHPERRVLPLPERLKGGAAHKVIDALAGKGLVEEVDAKPGEPVWRITATGHAMTLAATDAAFEALGLAPPASQEGANGADEAPAATEAAANPDSAPEADTAPKPRTPREGTKQALMIDMLRSEAGATIAEIVAATGWQAHTVRGAMAGALKKKLGLDVTSEMVEGRGRVYRL